MIDKTKEEYLRQLAEENVIPFAPPRAPAVSTTPVDTPPPVLDDERQRRLPALTGREVQGSSYSGPPLLCGTPLLDEGTLPHTAIDGMGDLRDYRRKPRGSYPLTLLAYAFFTLGVGINIWNAPPWPDGALYAAMGVLAEGVMFWLPAHALTLPPLRRLLAFALLAFVLVFALVNSLRMASIVSADMAMARGDKVTAAIRDAEGALADARVARDTECRKNGPLCRQRMEGVVKAEAALTAARAFID
jgi:hypothetical protein